MGVSGQTTVLEGSKDTGLKRGARESRVLILAPSNRDSILVRDCLREAGLEAELCQTMEALCQRIERTAGAAVIAHEALTDSAVALLEKTLSAAPAWSDLPLLVLINASDTSEPSGPPPKGE